jgi:hypothetical protein
MFLLANIKRKIYEKLLMEKGARNNLGGIFAFGISKVDMFS